MTVKHQEMAFIDQAAWDGDGVTSGTLGLGYPITTRVFNNSDEAMSYPGSPTHRKYDPVFTSMYKQNLTPPVFSLAMNRSSNSGWLAFGGLPPVDHKPDFAKTPIRVVSPPPLESTTANTENLHVGGSRRRRCPQDGALVLHHRSR